MHPSLQFSQDLKILSESLHGKFVDFDTSHHGERNDCALSRPILNCEVIDMVSVYSAKNEYRFDWEC